MRGGERGEMWGARVTYTYKAMESSAENTQLTNTVRCLNTRRGIVARSFCQIWMPMKTMMMRPKPSSVPHTLEFFHGYVWPPHCSASSRLTTAQMRNAAPIRSISFMRSLMVRWLYSRLGLEKKKNTTARETAPKGRSGGYWISRAHWNSVCTHALRWRQVIDMRIGYVLIQKHQRQDT
jgi:hypothetical protein